VGYSERINPGDKEHTVEKILKNHPALTLEIGLKINKLYQSVITYICPFHKVAEAAKVIEHNAISTSPCQ
jgi:UDP-N-acetyl-D-galactosamine dehydrogenase